MVAAEAAGCVAKKVERERESLLSKLELIEECLFSQVFFGEYKTKAANSNKSERSNKLKRRKKKHYLT